jgi:UDP-3-O-[3-hydroxymyristoyl] glucosamine N-acyltransferase
MIQFESISLKKVAEIIDAKIIRENDECFVSTLSEPKQANFTSLSFIISESYIKDCENIKAKALVIQKEFLTKVSEIAPSAVSILSSDDAYLSFAKFTEWVAQNDFYADWRLTSEHIYGASSGEVFSKVISPKAKIDPTVKIASSVVVCEEAVIGARTTLLPNVVIGPKVVIGEDCTVFPGVVIYPKVKIGNRVRIHSNCVIGSDGFGYARSKQGAVKIWHLGSVVIEDDVEIGSSTTIDRGTIKDTRIERGAKIDNLVQIGHNGHVMMGAIICAQSGLAGNVTVGRGAVLAGSVGVADKVFIGDGAIVGPRSNVSKDIPAGSVMMGIIPPKPRNEWWKFVASLEKIAKNYTKKSL